MSNLPQHIKEAIEREYPIDTITRDTSFVTTFTQQAALRGAEIALEKQWIRVEDGLPEKSQAVLAYVPYYGVKQYYFNQNGKWFHPNKYTPVSKYRMLTHWMPLPDEPETTNHP